MDTINSFKVKPVQTKSFWLATGKQLEGAGDARLKDTHLYVTATFPQRIEDIEGIGMLFDGFTKGLRLGLRDDKSFDEQTVDHFVKRSDTDKIFDFWNESGEESQPLFEIGQSKKGSGGLVYTIQASEAGFLMQYPAWKKSKGVIIFSQSLSLAEIHLFDMARSVTDSIIFADQFSEILASMRVRNIEACKPLAAPDQWSELKKSYLKEIYY
ncbi:hypothetical protein O3Q51_07790 [Cryomorphaceae bacterium 1068]|nr:hypothetical protein [Cryomorphaceae bacterium 1068]